MHRREFLKFAAVSMVLNQVPPVFALESVSGKQNSTHFFSPGAADPQSIAPDRGVKDRLLKSQFFDHAFDDDIKVSQDDFFLLNTSLGRLNRIQKVIGYGNFSLLDFDDAVTLARSYPSIGQFPKPELIFLEKIFYGKAKEYGFMGEKPIDTITGKINKKDVEKIAHSGHYLYRGRPVEMFNAIQEKIGPDVVLTSGIRSVMKQFLLFLNKTSASLGNLSMASRSLAPPGYSFHGIGDFDVGKKGFGVANFTDRFTRTPVYQKLTDLGYIAFRYDRGNDLGVRFEPWHIKVA
ncbi:MAG: M15 family metallopeptidase [Proteobacteria bacterium]|nr:peptidase M15 [Desulfobacula sp.]MBU3951561.1 M15 family metallopeptidase [Pseudomonadota bacterium]MBU4132241.1 M15 family metallopeptidase [Pseudomonadota bacterium]